MNDNRLLVSIIVVFALLCLTCICCAGIAAVLYGIQMPASSYSFQGEVVTPEIAPILPPGSQFPTPPPDEGRETPSASPESSPEVPSPTSPGATAEPTGVAPENDPSTAFTETLEIMENTIVQVNDPLDLADRLEGKQNLPRQLSFPVETYQEGDQKNFWVTDTDTSENFEVQATLEYLTENVYFWIEDGVSFRRSHLERLVDTFEDQIYPTNRGFLRQRVEPRSGCRSAPVHPVYAGYGRIHRRLFFFGR